MIDSISESGHLKETRHRLLCADAADLQSIVTEQVHLVVTSPPYPMIAMWDSAFSAQSGDISEALQGDRCDEAFESMHRILDRVWAGCHSLLSDGGFLCINIGDAVRSCGGEFRLYSNYTRIVRAITSMGFTLLPSIIWRKPANSPTKFMGSGMLPAGAYVTLEHEQIIICRKSPREAKNTAERKRRRRSAIFWEERNAWYSDLWSFTGTRQGLREGSRSRSGAFPLELPYRLISMYSWQGDTVLDPFAGTGTTTLAAIAAGRNSVAVERDAQLLSSAEKRALSDDTVRTLENRAVQRVSEHKRYLESREKPTKHLHVASGVPVVTGQETELVVPVVAHVEKVGSQLRCTYTEAQL